jgi:hypothetical protein
MNAVQKCVHTYVNAKMIYVENVPGVRRGDKGSSELKYDIFDAW